MAIRFPYEYSTAADGSSFPPRRAMHRWRWTITLVSVALFAAWWRWRIG